MSSFSSKRSSAPMTLISETSSHHVPPSKTLALAYSISQLPHNPETSLPFTPKVSIGDTPHTVCVYTCVCTRVCVHVCVYTCVCTRVSVHVCLYTCVCTLVSVHVCLRLHCSRCAPPCVQNIVWASNNAAPVGFEHIALCVWHTCVGHTCE